MVYAQLETLDGKHFHVVAKSEEIIHSYTDGGRILQRIPCRGYRVISRSNISKLGLPLLKAGREALRGDDNFFILW